MNLIFLASLGRVSPYIPRNSLDLSLGNRVRFPWNGALVMGKVKFVGTLPGQTEAWVGAHLSEPIGNCDGTFQGRKIFTW